MHFCAQVEVFLKREGLTGATNLEHISANRAWAEYLHSQRVTPGPESANVFLCQSNEDGRKLQVKIGDLGVARVSESVFAKTLVGTHTT